MISPKAWQGIQIGLRSGFLCATLALTANSQVKTETTVEEGLPSQTVKIETGEVVYVSGRDLVVKTADGELRHFPNVSDDKTVTVAGEQLTMLGDGMLLGNFLDPSVTFFDQAGEPVA